MKKLCSILFLSTLSFVSASAATLFTDGLPSVTDVYNTTVAGNFLATSGNVDVLQSTGAYGYLCGAAATCVDLDGNTAGSITSGVLTLAPGTYILTFTLGPAQRGTVGSATVSLDGLYTQTFTDPAPGTVTKTITVASATTAQLVFTSNTPGSASEILSGVSLATASTSSVPEPSTMLLLSLPLLAFGSMAFRRSRA